ncbi:MAG TPA: sulfite oxidase [Gaiellaceae bacterium]|nr:sulfite oxidase [Gaiellaceae bacterium]
MIDLDELQLAARNHGMPLELLRDPITPAGLHYLLIHFDIPHVDADTWRLEIGGLVRQPLSLSLAELRARPARTIPVTLECAGNGRALIPDHTPSQPWLREAVGTAEWTGTPLAPILAEAGLADSVCELVFTGLDRGIQHEIEHDYARSLRVAEALGEDVLLAYEMNGAPLPPQHGFPVRLVVPGWYGMAHVKWLRAITAIADEFEGYQQAGTYRIMRFEDDVDGPPVERMLPRSLLVPPGIPDFLSRERHLAAGRVVLRGRGWSGQAPVERVEVSDDGGATWAEAELEPPLGPYAWRGFSFGWDAAPGEYELCCRATDGAGNTQPPEPAWNYGGFCNNAVQRIRVSVSAR